MVCEIRSRRNSLKELWYRRSVYTVFHISPYKSHGVRSGDVGGQGNGPAPPTTSNVAPSTLETPYSFDSNRSATHGRYASINVTNKNLTSFLAAFKLFHVYICNRFGNTLISWLPNHLQWPCTGTKKPLWNDNWWYEDYWRSHLPAEFVLRATNTKTT